MLTSSDSSHFSFIFFLLDVITKDEVQPMFPIADL